MNPMKEEMCLMDSCITNTILSDSKYFQILPKRMGNNLIIIGRDACIVSSGKATIILPMSTQVIIENALLYLDSTHILVSYRDISKNMLHIVIYEENNEESLLIRLITKSNGDGYDILKRIPSLLSELYYTYIKLVPHIT
jgi:hypothetical protein